MRSYLPITILTLSCFAAGCSKDAEVNAFIKEFDGTTKEMIEKINADPSASGVDAAQKAFDARKLQLTAKWNEIKGAVGFQVSKDTRKKLEQSVTNNMRALTEASIKHMVKMAADKDASAKFKQLLKDYSDTFTMEAKQS
ncbi:hypothetical protein [Leptolyngbya sp. 7M]|uniref:hypothetical protein n=1 Tax=Leptolyngbya sp. 7M TaxID=2812896 RepID=UPI001B8D0468|nr:hypothetical protein [Leptolyngbya sp. 7M]QYO67406.1 hypothetical protein JVX88_11780 [Leptolyngbya sp. 7M]